MPPVQPLEPSVPPPINGNWYLLSVRSKKRDLFLKYLKIAISQNNIQELIMDIKTPQESVYEDIVLLNLSTFKTAYTYLQKIEYFQSIERKPLQLEQVSRMLGSL
ncbi:chromosome segregation ATPase [aff. Roholtiella sp. LEGE 12411]|uniref:chromosome segregation ATPase n=1 Tax=aff. Roholtiella sp. LEGE 12411 TaxID=1828822 RepID=UPI001882F9AE|nr:chromosome segregation ATPase [aff. Roholtiella sp. LEGE 12411]MBE9035165.1 chromosome segregation ATPase [aff. Roholtiella sp. LEGE 12411]